MALWRKKNQMASAALLQDCTSPCVSAARAQSESRDNPHAAIQNGVAPLALCFAGGVPRAPDKPQIGPSGSVPLSVVDEQSSRLDTETGP